MAAKRSAFGDISQTTRGNRPLTEILAVGKETKTQQEKKTSMLQQPAQKPLPTHNASTIQPLFEVSQNGPTRNILARRATTIFRDHSTLAHISQQINEGLPRKSESTAQPSAVLKSKVEVQLPEPIPTQSIESKPRSHSYLLAGIADLHIPTAPIENEKPLPTEVPAVAVPLKKSAALYEMPVIVDIRLAEAKMMAILHSKDNIIPQAIEPLPVKGPERNDYYDTQAYIDDYDENLEDDGYVTARSYRSRPDNLTDGNLTTILKPLINREFERELQAAAAVMSSLQEPSGADDDDWDISMVSEYKDEIFEYYLELEVRIEVVWEDTS